jgi:hypothetical protein
MKNNERKSAYNLRNFWRLGRFSETLYIASAPGNMDFPGEIVPISRKDYGNLKNLIPKDGEKIFHLAVPPEAVSDVVKIISDNFGREKIKIMLEKPFGRDLESARSLDRAY